MLGAIATLVIGVWFARWLARIAGKVLDKRSVDPTLTKFAISLVKITLITFVIISAISQVGIETTSFVAIIGAAGSVESIGIFVTTLVSPDNKVIIIPNSGLTGSNIVNYTVKDTRRVDMVFGIGYGDDIFKAKNIIKSVIDNDSRILKDPVLQIVVSELADSSVNFTVRPWVSSADYWGVYFDVTEQIKKKFDEQNISIPFPRRDIHMFQNQ